MPWAVCTHRAASAATRHQAYGDIHMLSHQVGAGQAADVRRLAHLETDNARLAAELRRRSIQHAGELDALRCRLGHAEQEARDARQQLATIGQLQQEIEALRSGQALARLEERLAELDAAQRRNDAQQARLDALQAHNQALARQLEAARSDASFIVIGDNKGLHRIQGLNSEAGQRVAAQRPFRDVADLARRADLARDDLERLAAVGALASLAGHRRQAAWSVSAVPVQRDLLLDESNPGLSAKLSFDVNDNVAAPYINTGVRPRMAILREQGVNGQTEMAAAFHRAGFSVVDVHMSDIIAGRVSLPPRLARAATASRGATLSAGSMPITRHRPTRISTGIFM